MTITVWICPTEGCGNYYASSNAGDLRRQMNTNAKNRETFARSRCPDCAQRGANVHREPREVRI